MKAAVEMQLQQTQPPTGLEIHEQEPKRAILGGVRKAPGGGSSLSMKDLHPGTPVQSQPDERHGLQDEPASHSANERHPGGKATFGFGW